MSVVAKNIRKYRLGKMMTQEKLAAACDRSVNQINGYERGRSNPSPRLLAIIANALDVTPADLLGEDAGTKDGEGREDVLALSKRLREAVADLHGINSSAITVSIQFAV